MSFHHYHEAELAETLGDIHIENHGTLFTFELLSQRALDFVDEHVEPSAPFIGKRTLVVEHRYARDLAELAVREFGLEVA